MFTPIRFSLITTMLFTTASNVQADDVKPFDVEAIRGVAYYKGADVDDVRHRLDMYLPKGAKDFPVLFWVHGGAWVKGDKNQFGVYGLLGKNFARHGIGFVSINYRLSPTVKHPEHVRDVARAFAWVHKNIGQHGGRPSEMFIGGHSAGGHLVALLAADATHLKEVGLSPRDIQGVLPISGVYEIPGDTFFDIAFDKNAEARKQASPVHVVAGRTPPFLLLYADSELPGCDGPCAHAFCKALLGKQCAADICEIKRRNHMTILLNATSDTDIVFQSMLSFMQAQVALDRLCSHGVDGIDCVQQGIARYAAIVGR